MIDKYMSISLRNTVLAMIAMWAVIGTFALKTPAFAIYIAAHLCTTGVLFFVISKTLREHEQR